MSSSTTTIAEYQLVLEKLSAATLKITTLLNTAEGMVNALTEHNVSEDAHLHLQNMIQAIDAVTVSQVSSVIANHNESISAHADMRALIADLSGGGLSTEALTAHNTSSTAHAYLRSLVNSLNLELEIVRENATQIENLDAVYDALGLTEIIGGSLTSQITEIQNDLVSILDTIGTHTTQTAALQATCASLGVRTTTLESTVNAINASISAMEITIATILANGGGTGGGVDMTNFTCTAPTIVQGGATYDVVFGGVDEIAGDALSFTVNPLVSEFVFSKTTDIALGETITVTIPDTVNAGELRRFSVLAVYETSGTTGTKSIIAKINTAPAVTNLVADMPESVEPGRTYNLSLSGATDPDGQTVSYAIGDVVVTGSSDLPTFSKTTDIASGETITITIPATATRGTTYAIPVTASDTLGASTVKSLPVITVNILPDLAALVITARSIVKPGGTYVTKFAGATAADGGALTYSITTPANCPIIFAKTTGILANENVLTYIDTDTSVRGQVFTMSVTVKDSYGAEATASFSIKINRLPLATTVYTNLPGTLEGNQLVTFQINGGSDPDGQAFTYSIVDTAGLTFSKTTSIATGESIVVNVPNVSVATSYSFDIAVVDSMGETSATVRSQDLLVTAVGSTTYTVPPSILYPTSGDDEVPNGFTLLLTPYEAGSSVTYITAQPNVIAPIDGDKSVDDGFTVIMSAYSTTAIVV